MVKNLVFYKIRAFFRKLSFRLTAFPEKAVYYTYENTPQTSVTGDLSSSPTLVLITVSTITQGAKCHIEITFFISGFHGYISSWTWLSSHFPGPSLAGQGGSVHSLVIFICHKTCLQIPSWPPRQAFLWQIIQIPLLLCSSLPAGLWTPMAPLGCQFSRVGPRLLAFQETGRGVAVLWDALSSKSTGAETSPTNAPGHKGLRGEEPGRVLPLMMIPVPQFALLRPGCWVILLPMKYW